jgi:hypothetical protein
VVDEQELDHRVLGFLDLVGLGVDDHAVADRRRAGGLELGDALDLDQAHAAGADRLTELGLVTEDGISTRGRVHQHGPGGRGHRLPLSSNSICLGRQVDGRVVSQHGHLHHGLGRGSPPFSTADEVLRKRALR